MTNWVINVPLARPLHARQSVPATIRTVSDALNMIAALDRASRASLHWRLALNVLEYAQAVKSRKAIELATDAVENALATDNWLAPSSSS